MNRIGIGIIVAALAAGIALGAAPTSAQAAPPVLTNMLTVPKSSPKNTQAVKRLIVVCPNVDSTHRRFVLGGGARISSNGLQVDGLVRFTQLEPSNDIVVGNTVRSGYMVTAAVPEGLSVNAWGIDAWAYCTTHSQPGNGGNGMIIRKVETDVSSSPVKQEFADCPTGTVALGSGAAIRGNDEVAQNVALQAARPSDAGHTIRAQAHEDVNGYGGLWQLAAISVCGPRYRGYDNVFGRSGGSPSAPGKMAFARCTVNPHSKAINIGAAAGSDAPADVALTGTYPTGILSQEVAGVAWQMERPYQDWGFIVVTATCVDVG